MTTLTLILLIALLLIAITLLLGELFFFPGLGLPGIVGGAGLIGIGGYLIYTGQYVLLGILTIGGSLLFVLGFYLLSRSRVLSKISLTKEVDDQVNLIPTSIQLGDRGECRSRLALSGTVEIKGHLIEATSEQGFMPEGTHVFVSRITKDKVYVSIDTTPLHDTATGEQ